VRTLFDQRLTDPTATEVADAIGAAVEAVNAGRKAGQLPPADGVTFGARVVRESAGREAFFGAGAAAGQPPIHLSRVVLAWWTNPAGRKLVRVRGWRESDPRVTSRGWPSDPFALIERDLHNRPFAWHVDPERVVETFTGGDPEWVAVCGCGAAASPEALGWHHGMCGPCADRVAEFGPDAVAHEPGCLANSDFEPHDVTFTGDGRFVVAVGPSRFRFWDATTGWPRGSGIYTELDLSVRAAPAPDGRYVFLADRDAGGLLLVPADGSVHAPFDIEGDVRAAHWTGRPNELLLQTLDSTLQLANATAGHLKPVDGRLGRRAKLQAVWPDQTAPRAVFTDDHTAVVVRVRADGTTWEEARFLLGVGQLTRTGVWEGGPKVVRFTPDGERLLFIRGTEIELRLPSRAKALQQVEFPRPVIDAGFAPDGERVYVLTADGVIHVCSPGMLTSVRARLRWHIDPPSRLAIAPHGRTLATAGPEGVKLWPLASLLPLLE
jgi:hypothetical protein